jgi:protein TonB
VRVASDGHLVDAVVSRSSGHVELDQAALNILRLSAPFEPFPAALAAEHDSVRLTYEWQFSDGQWTDSAVRVPANTR